MVLHRPIESTPFHRRWEYYCPSLRQVWHLNGCVEKRSRTLKPMDPNILSPIYLFLVIILAIERPASAKSKSQIKHEVRSRLRGN
jgi:hypothetical protein